MSLILLGSTFCVKTLYPLTVREISCEVTIMASHEKVSEKMAISALKNKIFVPNSYILNDNINDTSTTRLRHVMELRNNCVGHL